MCRLSRLSLTQNSLDMQKTFENEEKEIAVSVVLVARLPRGLQLSGLNQASHSL